MLFKCNIVLWVFLVRLFFIFHHILLTHFPYPKATVVLLNQPPPPHPTHPKTPEVFLESPTPLPEQCVQEESSSVRLLCLKSIHTLKAGIPAWNSSTRSPHTRSKEKKNAVFSPLSLYSLLRTPCCLKSLSPKSQTPRLSVSQTVQDVRDVKADHVTGCVSATCRRADLLSSPFPSVCVPLLRQ